MLFKLNTKVKEEEAHLGWQNTFRIYTDVARTLLTEAFKNTAINYASSGMLIAFSMRQLCRTNLKNKFNSTCPQANITPSNTPF